MIESIKNRIKSINKNNYQFRLSGDLIKYLSLSIELVLTNLNLTDKSTNDEEFN